jgi:hypothetical protein
LLVGNARPHHQLDRLLHKYDLSEWIYTKEIAIDDDAIPHSDPVLTLHTRHLKDDDLLLSTFVHEQMHRFLALRAPEDVNQVVWLEYRADLELLGELRARQVMEFWAQDHYTCIYRNMLDRPVRNKISEIIQNHGLVPTA